MPTPTLKKTPSAQKTDPAQAIKTALLEKDKFLKRVATWYEGDHTGISSKTIMSVMLGTKPQDADIPHDPSDFGRCHHLLKKFPEFRPRLPEVAKKYPAWKEFVKNWDRMEKLYERDLSAGKSTELFRLMRGFRSEKTIQRNVPEFNIFRALKDSGDAIESGLPRAKTSTSYWTNKKNLDHFITEAGFKDLMKPGYCGVLVPKHLIDLLPYNPQLTSTVPYTPENVSVCKGLVKLRGDTFENTKSDKYVVLIAKMPVEIPFGNGVISIKSEFDAGLVMNTRKPAVESTSPSM